MEFSQKTSLTTLLNNSQIYFIPNFISFVARNIVSLRSLNTTLFNRTNNIVDSNADVAQLKVLLDPLLEELFEERILLGMWAEDPPKVSSTKLYLVTRASLKWPN
jgi:hypothetical protein